MIAKYNNISLTCGIPGIILQIAGRLIGQPVVIIAGTVLLMVGLAYYAKAKGRSPAWCLMGFLSLVGLIVLACLKDCSKNCEQTDEDRLADSLRSPPGGLS